MADQDKDKGSTALARIPEGTFALALPNAADLADIMADNFGQTGLSEFDLERIRVPAGGGLSWQLIGPDGTLDEVKAIDGVIVAWKDVRAFWRAPFGTAGKAPPDCSSQDSVWGHGDPGGDCSQCPYAQFGSKTNDKGEQTQGQACKQMRALFIIREGEALPSMMGVPPTSIKPIRQYFLRLASGGNRYRDIVSRFTLTPAQNQGGIRYSQVQTQAVKRLSAEAREQIRLYAEAIGTAIGKGAIDVVANVVEPDPVAA